MGQIRTTGTQKRHEKVYSRYIELRNEARAKDPVQFRSTALMHFYNIVADETGYSADKVSRIVRECLRLKGSTVND